MSIKSRLAALERVTSRNTEGRGVYWDDSGDAGFSVHVTRNVHAWFPGPGREDTDPRTLPKYYDRFPNNPNSDSMEN